MTVNVKYEEQTAPIKSVELKSNSDYAIRLLKGKSLGSSEIRVNWKPRGNSYNDHDEYCVFSCSREDAIEFANQIKRMLNA